MPTPGFVKWLAQTLETAPGGKGRIVPMEGMRGVAVLLVFLVHHHALFGKLLPGGPVQQASLLGHAIGHSGVDLFFLLSGYLIYGHLLQRRSGYFAFVRKRVRRIYPTFLAVLGVYCLVCLVMPAVSKLPPGGGPTAIYLLQNALLLPGIFHIEPLITVAWSLSYEFFFYLLIPVIILATGMRAWSGAGRAVFFGLLLLAFAAAYQAGLHSHPRLGLFLAGILLYETIIWGGWNSRLTRVTEVAAIGLYLLTLMILACFRLGDGTIRFEPGYPDYTFLPWSILLSCALYGLSLHAFAFSGWVGAFFSFTPLRWLGNMSYSFFLFHGFVLNAAAFVFKKLGWYGIPEALFPGVLLLNLLLTLAGSLVLFLLVEKPLSLAVAKVRNTGGNKVASPTAV
jgi:exopolysaccharide production protein ExoZ